MGGLVHDLSGGCSQEMSQHCSGSLFLHPLQHLLFVDFLDGDHAVIIPHCSFDIHSSNN